MLTRREATAGIAATAVAVGAGGAAHAEEAAARPLPTPRSSGSMPLIDALKLRRSTRAYSERPLEPQVLSDLLWAANGVNRPSGDRTAPYWRHIMVTDIYTAMADGVWLYDPNAHALVPHMKDDLRAESGTQDFVGIAPLDLVYVAHGERMTDVGPEERRLFASADGGSANQAKLGAALNLPEGQFVTFAQTVGYPQA